MTVSNYIPQNSYVYYHVYRAEVFYIGKGVGNRANSKTARNKLWLDYVSKINGDFEVLIVQEFYSGSEVECSDYESRKIAEHRPCCNVADNPDRVGEYLKGSESFENKNISIIVNGNEWVKK